MSGYVEKSTGLDSLLPQVDRAAAASLRETLAEARDEIRLQGWRAGYIARGRVSYDAKLNVIYANRMIQDILNRSEHQLMGTIHLLFSS